MGDRVSIGESLCESERMLGWLRWLWWTSSNDVYRDQVTASRRRGTTGRVTDGWAVSVTTVDTVRGVDVTVRNGTERRGEAPIGTQ